MKLNLFKKFLAMAVTVASLTAFIPVNTFAAELPVTKLKVSKEAEHIVLICGHKSNKNKVTVNDYLKDSNGNWYRNWQVGGVCGMNGISTSKVEGDKKTPEGVFSPTISFGLKDNPGSKLDYHKIVEGDYWVDDSNSPYYNKLVNTNTTAKNWNSAEDMLGATPYYNYAISLDYNIDAVPNKGSAVFIHCTKDLTDTYSAGCIRIPEEYMIKLVNSVDSKTKIVILENVDKLTMY